MPTASSETDALERRRATIRASAARLRERLSGLTRAEQLAWRLRESLGEGFDPYTQPERKRAEEIRRRLEEIQKDADMLHQEMTARLGRSDKEGLRHLGALLAAEKASRVELKPF